MSRPWRATILLAVTGLLLAAALDRDRVAAFSPQAQPPAAQAASAKAEPARQATPAPQAPPVFRAGVELVRLDVRVVDDSGLPVRDLGQDEVRVVEGGVQRPIVLFQHVAEPAGTYLEAARRTIGAEVSTNQGAPRGHLYLIVFDQNHITAGNEQRARQAVDRFVRTRVKPGDRVALYALPGPGPQLPLTSNTSLVLAELPKVRGALDRQGLAVGSTMSEFEAFEIVRGDINTLQTFLNRVASNAAASGDSVARTNTTTPASALSTSDEAVMTAKENARTAVERSDVESRAFLASLGDLIRQLAQIEGRKTVILVSEGFFTDNLRVDIDRVAAAAAESYAVIYSMDINRRMADLFSADSPTGASAAQEVQSRLDSLTTLSNDTSGRVLLDAGSRMDEALNEVANASQDYYIVGFEPSPSALGDRREYRHVSVSVTRRGARVATRTGYALRDPVTPADRRRSIDAALGAPFPQQGLPLEMTTYVLRGTSPGAQRVFLSLQADLPVATGDRARSADVVFVARSARDGRVVASGTDTMPLPKAAAPGRTTASGQYHVQFDAPAGEYLLRVAVREPGGTTGTVDRRFDVRPLDGVDVTASDLIVGRRADALPVRARCYTAEGLTAALDVYARNPVDLETVDVTVDLLPLNAESAVRSIKADLMDVRSVGSGAGRTAQIAMPLEGVAPGEYVVRATLHSRGEAVTELMRQVDVVPGAPPAPPPAAPPERVTPSMILAGELGRHFIVSLQETAADAAVKAAAAQAAAGEWAAVERALPQPAGPRPFAYHALRGLALFAAERYDEAGTSLEAALTQNQSSAQASFFLGWTRANGGRTPEAVTAWRNAVLHDPAMVPAYLALAEIYGRLKHPELALQVLNDGLRLNPASIELRTKLAEVGRK
jgi:VWFA-related protein